MLIIKWISCIFNESIEDTYRLLLLQRHIGHWWGARTAGAAGATGAAGAAGAAGGTNSIRMHIQYYTHGSQ